LIQDLTGDFLGKKASIIPNNEDIAQSAQLKSQCQFEAKWNAF